ncbi:APH(6) family putative aminoglycoside O-phosphotransferase [Pseudoroseomonas wenyumeiae]|uniref:APH(6) family putative aminoglycoside O-phosphotransferase n=1 Tax=Teichococcus wenyumeiae TaxID=2478470 RepID=A0ABX9VDC8_9PROT|nr:aminoglycoside phosphotransferase family protein [Pseudoroseomonas wenyumeiae]RMI17299.1 APH(6) family putative aminoglycoside O-phosphotransferase [Pseudoroseomonas wenyumeiae]
MFESYLTRWDLAPDGAPITTPAAHLLPVLKDGKRAMLKLSHEADERLGGVLMEWWSGDGAARVFARDGDALLMERATGPASLSDMARSGSDDEACRILCAAAARLHAPRSTPLPELTPLREWFRDLWPAAAQYSGILTRCAETARMLLAEPREVAVLHGDLHHDNVLDFGERGWLAIDPKHLIGERGFDFANIFTNPDLADPARPVATQPGRFTRRLDIIAAAGGLDRRRLLSWVLAWTGLSASWFLGDDAPLAEIALRIAALAATELDR